METDLDGREALVQYSRLAEFWGDLERPNIFRPLFFITNDLDFAQRMWATGSDLRCSAVEIGFSHRA